MGCWYETDFLSHLHIEKDEDIVMILVRQKNSSRHKVGKCCNPYDICEPFGLPVHGKYDETGAVTEVKNVDDVLDFLNQFKYEVDEHSADALSFPFTNENLADFLYAVSVEDISVNKELISCMYINERLYNILIDDYKNRTRTNDGHTYTYEKLLENCCDRFLDGIKSGIESSISAGCFKDMAPEECFFRYDFRDYFNDFPGLRISDFVSNKDIIRYLMERVYKDKKFKTKYIEYVKEVIIFNWVLESMRSGYLCVSGSGGNTREMKLQKLLAEYILTRCDEEVARYREENICDESDTDDRILSDAITDVLWL